MQTTFLNLFIIYLYNSTLGLNDLFLH
jgi:hypothetical protein